ncbi:Uncharacterised protein [Serratia quinivorans]|nr:Uncharacterised protein [Serratia quinivorans]CAI1726046.1 Uncharacterised protein [Serratia quinivorans]
MQVGAFGLGVGPVAKTDAYSNIAQFYRVNASSANAPPITGNIAAGVASLPCDAAPSTGYVAVSGNGAGFIGSSNTPANGVKWSRVYTTDYKPSAGDVDAYSQLESDYRFILRSGDAIDYLYINKGLAVGLDTIVGGTLYVNGLDFIMKRGLQDVVNNERQTNGMRIQGGGDLFVDLYQRERVGQHHFFGIHVANGGSDNGWYEFRNDGSFNAGSTVGAGGANGSKLYPDGNISGSTWGGYLKDWIFHNTISRVMRGAQGSMTMDGGMVEAPAGCYLTGGNGNEGNQVDIALYRPLQIWRSGYWQTIEG